MDAYGDFPDAPLPLIEIREGPDQGPSGWSLATNSDTIKLLAGITEPVCTIAVAGLYRSGKSSLLNWLRARCGA